MQTFRGWQRIAAPVQQYRTCVRGVVLAGALLMEFPSAAMDPPGSGNTQSPSSGSLQPIQQSKEQLNQRLAPPTPSGNPQRSTEVRPREDERPK